MGREDDAREGRSLSSELVASRWDAEYREGRYASEPPLAFTDEIVATLRAHPTAFAGTGLYVGCGNGRNYLPLVDAGLRVCGLDVSLTALRQLAARRPARPLPLICGDFRSFTCGRPVGFVVAIQVFQHGTEADAATYFDRVKTLLQPGGLFFLRVNSVSTQVFHRHTVLDRNERGGATVRYDAGPKQGLAVHFYAREELADLTGEAFEVVVAPREDVIMRSAPQTGFWAQWEATWRRR